jgi:hypothetical protein
VTRSTLNTSQRVALTAGVSALALAGTPAGLFWMLRVLNGPLWEAAALGAPDWIIVLALHATQLFAVAAIVALLAWVIARIWRKR